MSENSFGRVSKGGNIHQAGRIVSFATVVWEPVVTRVRRGFMTRKAENSRDSPEPCSRLRGGATRRERAETGAASANRRYRARSVRIARARANGNGGGEERGAGRHALGWKLGWTVTRRSPSTANLQRASSAMSLMRAPVGSMVVCRKDAEGKGVNARGEERSSRARERALADRDAAENRRGVKSTLHCAKEKARIAGARARRASANVPSRTS